MWGVIASAGGLITNAVSAFVSSGATALSRNVQSFNDKIKGSFFIKISSWASVQSDVFNKKIGVILSTRIDAIKSTNPRATVKYEIKNPGRSKKATAFVEGKGFDDFADVMDQLSANISSIISVEATQSVENMRAQLMQYPAERQGSAYNRTFELQRGWQVAVAAFDLNINIDGNESVVVPIGPSSTTVALSNPTPYGKWVQRRATQTSIHRGRWNTVEDVSEQEAINLTNRIEATINSLF
jgi:hypothetical protein